MTTCGITRRCSGSCGRRSAWTSRCPRCASPKKRLRSTRAGSSTSSRAASAGISNRSALHDLAAAARHSGLARRHARERHRPRAQPSPVHAAQFQAARRRRREPTVLRARSHRAWHRSGQADGTITVPSGPGIGVNLVPERARVRNRQLCRTASPVSVDVTEAHIPLTSGCTDADCVRLRRPRRLSPRPRPSPRRRRRFRTSRR